jgi:hypothetical protein
MMKYSFIPYIPQQTGKEDTHFYTTFQNRPEIGWFTTIWKPDTNCVQKWPFKYRTAQFLNGHCMLCLNNKIYPLLGNSWRRPWYLWTNLPLKRKYVVNIWIPESEIQTFELNRSFATGIQMVKFSNGWFL